MKENGDTLKKPGPPDRHALRDKVGGQIKERDDGHDAQPLVMDSCERLHAAKPEGKELVGPSIGLENL